MKVTGYKRFFVEMAVLFIVYLAVAALHGCAIACFKDDTETGTFKGTLWGIGSAKSSTGAEMSVLKLPEGVTDVK